MIRFIAIPWLMLASSAPGGEEMSLPGNLLANPGFELVADGQPVGWSYVGPEADSAATLAEGEGHTGTRFIRFSVTRTPRSWESAPVAVRGNELYRLEWWTLAEMRAHSSFGGLRVRFYDVAGEPCGVYERRSRVRGTLGWAKAWVRFTAPPEAQKCIVAVFGEATNPTEGSVAVDDVSLVAINDRARIPSGSGLLEGVVHTGDSDDPGYARVIITGSDGQRHTPVESYRFLDGSFHAIGEPFEVVLPPGPASVIIIRGFDCAVWRDTVEIRPGMVTPMAARLVRREHPDRDGWYGGDAHVHFVGHRSTIHPQMRAETVVRIGCAEGLSWVSFKNASVPDFVKWGTDRLCEDCLIEMGVEATSDFHGHFYTANLRATPEQRFPGGTAAWPMAYDLYEELAPQNVVMAFAHPYGRYRMDSTLVDVADPGKLVVAREWPLDLALGQSPPLDILCHDGGHRTILSSRDYYRALNCGFRFGLSGSSDAYVDQGRLKPGAARTYVRSGDLSWDSVAQAYRRGASFVTNGPLLRFLVNGSGPGDEVRLRRGSKAEITLYAGSNWGVTKAEVLRNGQVVHTAYPGADGDISERVSLDMPESGWLALRAFGPKSDEIEWETIISPEWQDLYGQFAHTSPVYVVVNGQLMRPDPEAARYFVGWMDAYRTAFDRTCEQLGASNRRWQDEGTRAAVHERMERARSVYERMAEGKR